MPFVFVLVAAHAIVRSIVLDACYTDHEIYIRGARAARRAAQAAVASELFAEARAEKLRVAREERRRVLIARSRRDVSSSFVARANAPWITFDADDHRDARCFGDAVLVPDTDDVLERSAALALANEGWFDRRKFSSRLEANRDYADSRFGCEAAQVGETLAWVSEDEAASERELVAWLGRDAWLVGEPDLDRRGGEVDAISQQRKRSSEREWLERTLSQLRVDFRSAASASEKARVAAHGKRLKARYNVRRYLEAFGQDFNAEPIQAWLKAKGYRKALALLVERAEREYVTATELIAA